jgi:glycosyltransferase involved in cell wall biosynthesis
MTRMIYSTRWAKPRESTWSGTTWHLRQALAKRFEIEDFEIPELHGPALFVHSAVTHMGHRDLDLTTIRNGDRAFRRSVQTRPGDVVLQFDECPMPEGGREVLHYVYQDNCVEYLYRALEEGTQDVEWLGLRGTRLADVRRRLESQREFYGRCAGVLTMGRWLADYLVDECGLPREKVHHVGGGSNLPPDAGDGRHVLDPNAPVFLFVGRAFERKGGPEVLEAFRFVRGEIPDARLLVAGPASDPRRPDDDGVDWLGDCPGERVAELLSEADAFVMPSHFEAYGIVFVEALSRGVPCVGRDVCEMSHFIRDGANGVLVQTDDSRELSQAMLRCVRDSSIRAGAESGVGAARRDYSWDAVTDRIAEIVDYDQRLLGVIAE